MFDKHNSGTSERISLIFISYFISCILNCGLQALIQLICDVKSMEDAVIEMKFDAKKSPLGNVHYRNFYVINFAHTKFVQTVQTCIPYTVIHYLIRYIFR